MPTRSIASATGQGARGPLHGIPILLKDNIDTADRQGTRAGSLALAGRAALQDATVAARLRRAGAVILGKANLSEWANFRGFGSSSGWSGVGGQCRNPYVLDRNPCGSSSGSAAAVSAALTSVALGTETDGSIVCPSGQSGVAGIKPTVGLTSRAGVVPIAAAQDTVGPHGRRIADCAAVLGALTGVDPRDPATAASAGHFFRNYTQFLDPNGLAGANIGVARQFLGVTTEIDEVFEEALGIMSSAGANLVDVEIPSFDEYNASQAEIIVLIFEFKRDLNAYLATRRGVPAGSLADVIQFNLDHAHRELRFFGQELMERAEAEVFDEATYLQALADARRQGGADGIDATLANFGVDAIVAPTNSAGLAHRSGQRRCLPVWQLGIRGGGGLSAGECHRRLFIRAADRNHVHGLGVERADIDQARVRFRGRRRCPPPTALPPDARSRRQHRERAECEDCGRGIGSTAATRKSCARPADDAPPVAACGPVGQAGLVSPRAIIPGRPFAGPVFLLFNKNNGLDSA